VDVPTPLHRLQFVLGIFRRIFLLAASLGTVCSVYKPMIAGGEVVTLAHVAVVVGCLFDWHLRLLELLADLRRPLVSPSVVALYFT